MTQVLVWGSLLWLVAMQIAVEILTPRELEPVANAVQANFPHMAKRAREYEALQARLTIARQAESVRVEQAKALREFQARKEERRLGRLFEARNRDPFQPYEEPFGGCGLDALTDAYYDGKALGRPGLPTTIGPNAVVPPAGP